MSIKTTGSEFLAFYHDDAFWPEGSWHEEESLWIDGELYENPTKLNKIIKQTSILKIKGGVVLGLPNEKEPSLESYFKAWRRKQATVSFVVSGDKERAEELKAFIKSHGFKVE